MWSIGLIDLNTFEAVAIKGADPANEYKGRGEPWFTFPTPPSQYEISEPAATNITPTQDGGKYIEHQGNIFKEIRIAGTVGLRPNPVSNELIPGLSKDTGVVINTPTTIANLAASDVIGNDYRGLRPAEITGLDDITFLRNIFRGYYDLKRRNEFASRIAMVWMCAKESDWYIVEPLSFQTTRDSSNPLSWMYNIQLRTLYRFDVQLAVKRDPLSNIQTANSVWRGVNQAVKDITRAINQIAFAVESVIQLPFDLTNKILNVATSILTALANIRNLESAAEMITRRGLRQFEADSREIRLLATQIKYGQAPGNESIGKRVFGGPSSPTGGDPVPPTDDAALAILRDMVIRSFAMFERTAKRLHAMDLLFESSKQVQVTDYSNRYLEDGEPPATSGSRLDPNNIVVPDSATEVDVVGDIRAIAKQYLGSEEFWKMLVVLNGLKYPYISTVASDGVLAFGDKILIPKRPDEGDLLASTQETLTDADQQELSPVVRKYGRDLRLTDGSSGTDFSDIKVSQRGDLEVIEGIPNVEQAMMIKFSTEQGELALHPTFGARFPIGTKLLLGRIQEFAINTRRTVMSDPRVESLDRLRIFADGDVLNVRAHASLKQSDVKLPVEFAVRRG
jgi:hypothetical protein